MREYLEADKAFQDSFDAPRQEVAQRMATTQKAKEKKREHFVTEATRFINSHGVEAFRAQMNDVAGPAASKLSNEALQVRSIGLDKGHGLELSLSPQTLPKGQEGEE